MLQLKQGQRGYSIQWIPEEVIKDIKTRRDEKA
jgi:hypothetical protein